MSYESLFRHCIYPFYESVVCRRKTFSYFKYYDKNQWLPEPEIQKLQWQALKSLLEHCHKNVPYYQKLWGSLDIHPEDIKSMADFEKLPIITKKIITENYEDLIAENYRGLTMRKTTGGSTGIPFKFEYTRESYERRTAVAWRGYEWAGLPLGKRTAYLWGADLGSVARFQEIKTRLYHRFFNRLILNSFVMSKDNMISYVERLNKFQPEAMVCYVSPLYTLALYIEENGLDIHSPEVIITGAEPLFEFQREKIESVLSCRVMNTYGCREFMLIAAECPEKSGLHINQDHLVVETLNEAGQNILNVSGNLAITDLYNYGMPMIRYLNGDLATIGSDKCACGRQLPLMSSIEGRQLDSIKTSSGAVLPGEFFPHLLKDIPGIDAFQVIQDSLSGVKINLVKNNKFELGSKDTISAELHKITGPDFVIEFEFVDEIKLTDSGKRRVTISRI